VLTAQYVRKPHIITERVTRLRANVSNIGPFFRGTPLASAWVTNGSNGCLSVLPCEIEAKRHNMIHEVAGDILLTKAQAIAHGVSPNEHFDSGLALALREQWPAMAKDFRHYAHQSHPKPGELWTWSGVGGALIYNLLTQEGEHEHGAKAGRATVANVNHCLKRLRHELEKAKVKGLAMPRLATGAGGLAWVDVKRLIVQHLGDLPIPIYIYTTYHKGQQANEAGE
jgi:O-acetyl-ADP-ribose deacetylase (regulator of RNase III)